MKRIIAMIMVCFMVVACCGGAFAAGGDSVEPMASPTIAAYSAYADTGINTGEVDITFRITASQTASYVGVSSIAIYKSDGTYVTTITGSTANGLMATNISRNVGTYTYKGISGQYYYAKVKVFATVGSNYDDRTVTTNTVRAK